MIRPSAQGLIYLVKELLHVHRNIQSGSPFFSSSIAGTKKKWRKLQRKQGNAWAFNATAPSPKVQPPRGCTMIFAFGE